MKTNRITYLVETTEPLFSFSHVFLLIICIFPILESVWKNLPCRQYYAAAKHLFLLELFISLSLFFFAQCELQYARLLVTVYVDHFFLNSSVRFVSGSSLCLIPSPNKTSLSRKVYFQSKGWIGCTMPLLW